MINLNIGLLQDKREGRIVVLVDGDLKFSGRLGSSKPYQNAQEIAQAIRGEAKIPNAQVTLSPLSVSQFPKQLKTGQYGLVARDHVAQIAEYLRSMNIPAVYEDNFQLKSELD